MAPFMSWEKLGSSGRCSKELQISKSISMQAKCISVKFSWKRSGLAKVGGERQELGWQKQRWQEARVAKCIRSFVLRTYAVGEMG